MNIKITTTMPKTKKSVPCCSICCEPYTRATRATVKCGHCDFEACKQCVRRYLLSKSDLYHCMNCNNPWDIGFARKELNSAFVDGSYKQHRKELLFDIEKARLPETMPYVERYLSIVPMEAENQEISKEIDRLQNLMGILRNKKISNKNHIEAYKRGNYTYNIKKGESKKPAVFMRACPVDDCRGFLSTQWKCGVCNIFVCNKCLEPIGDDKTAHHECNDDSVKTAAMLKKETKNCPSCAATIYKISGCDQMWCTQCHIAFSWKTGQKVNGVIHNPHFYQWERNNGGATQNPQAVHCGGIPDYYYYRNKVRTFRSHIGVEMENTLMRFHRAAQHFLNVELRNMRTKVQRNTDNMDLRVKYLAKELSQDTIKKKLASRDTAKMKARAILDIYELFNTVATEGMVNIYNLNVQTCLEGIKVELDKVNRVRNYCNKELRKVSLTYRQTVKMIKPTLYTESQKFSSWTSASNLATYRKYYFEQPYEWQYDNHTLIMKQRHDASFLSAEAND